MTEIIKELLVFYKEKTKLPIVSTYVILLIVWNWDIISIYLFASFNMETRICLINNMVKSDWQHIVRVFCPVIIALSYPFITESLSAWTDKKLLSIRRERRSLKNQENEENAESKFRISEAESGKRTNDELLEQIKESNTQRDLLSDRLKTNEEFYKKEIEKLKLKLRKVSSIKKSDERPMYEIVDEELEFYELYKYLESNHSSILEIIKRSQKRIISNSKDIEQIDLFNENFKNYKLFTKIITGEGSLLYQLNIQGRGIYDYIKQLDATD